MPSVTFVGKHSRDKQVSIYLDRRIYVDEGDGTDPVSGIVRIDPQLAKSITNDGTSAVFCSVACYFIYECYDFEVEIIDTTLFQRTVQLHPRSYDSNQPKSSKSLQLPDEFHLPFEFRLPAGLPPSITLNPGFVYLGRPLGISYEVTAYVAPLGQFSVSIANMRSRVALRFRKVNYFPILNEIRPTETGEKVYLGGSKPLLLTATLDREIYYPGQPIMVSVEVRNQSSHDVHKIRISAKQRVVARVHASDREKYKCQVALLESTRGCPIKKHSNFSHVFSVTPHVITHETYHIAQVGRLNMSEEPQLAPSTRRGEGSDEKKGLHVSYYINVHCEVSLAKDLIVKIPFIMSGGEKKEEISKKSRKDLSHEVLPPETELLVNQLISLGYSKMQASQALKDHGNNFEQAFDWLKAHKGEPGSDSPPPGAGDDVLISFEDAELLDDHVPSQFDPSPELAAARGAGVSQTESTTLLNDINRAGEAIAAARVELVTIQAAAAQGILAPMPVLQNEYAHLINAIGATGSKLQEFLSDLGNPNDPSIRYSSAYIAANQFKTLMNIVKSAASHASNSQTKQSLLNTMNDLLERFFLLLSTARESLSQPLNAENRRKIMSLTDAISQGFTALRAALPGLKDIDMAVSTINTAASELSFNLPSGVDSEQLQQSLDNLNSFASQLSQIFQKLGTASTGPTDELANVAQNYRKLLPLILACGKAILGGMVNEQARSTFLKILQDAAATNVQLLLAAKETNVAPTDSILKSRLEERAREVVEAMKKLLLASNSLQNQLKASSVSPSPVRVSSQTGTPQGGTPQPAPSVAPQVAAPAAKPANPMIEQFKPSSGMLKRKDSFDEFIVHRAGSKPASAEDTPKDATAIQLEQLVKELDLAQKNVLAARARPRSASFGKIPNQPPSSGSAILDSALSISQSSHHLVMTILECYKEIAILGTPFPAEVSGKLVAAGKVFTSSITELVNRSNAVATADEDVTRLIVASTAASGAAANLLDSCHALPTSSATTQQDIETTAKDAIKRLTLFVSTVISLPTPPPSQGGGEPLEKHMRMLQLENELGKERSNELLTSPRKIRAPKSFGNDSD